MLEQSRQKHTIIEIGCGVQPFAISTERRSLNAHERYVGVDLFTTVTDKSKRLLLEQVGLWNRLFPGERSIIQADARSLEFPNQTINEVVLVNFADKGIGVDTYEAIIKEIARILRPDGIATVVEAYSPRVMPLEKLQDLMIRHGGLQQINQGGEKDYEAVSHYTSPSKVLKYSPADAEDYIALFSS